MKLISVDNEESVGNMFVGTSNKFTYDGTRFFFGDLYSSTVQCIDRIGDNTIVVVTRNSVYTFEDDK